MPNTSEPSTDNHCLSLQESVPEEIKFLIACCQTTHTEEDTVFIFDYLNALNTSSQSNDASPLSLSTITTMASRHGVLPLVYKTLKNLAQTNNTVTIHSHYHSLITELKARYQSIAQRNMLMSAELLRIMQLLEQNTIDTLAFKGPTLSQAIYGDITLRQFGDLDILIKKEDRTQVVELLKKNGYVPEITLKKCTEKTFFNHVNVIGMHHHSLGIYIEIHWELLSKNYAINWKETDLWHKKTYIIINHKKLRILPPEQMLLYLCVHGSKHLFTRLEWICDIDRTFRATPKLDWELLYQEAEKLGIVRMLHLGVALSAHFFTLSLPKNIQDNIQKDNKVQILLSQIIAINFSKTTESEKNYSTFTLLWNMREKFRDRLRFTWYALFATKFDDFKYIQLPDYFSFLYPFIRPFRLITKYFHHKS